MLLAAQSVKLVSVLAGQCSSGAGKTVPLTLLARAREGALHLFSTRTHHQSFTLLELCLPPGMKGTPTELCQGFTLEISWQRS